MPIAGACTEYALEMRRPGKRAREREPGPITPCRLLVALEQMAFAIQRGPGLWFPAFAGTTPAAWARQAISLRRPGKTHTLCRSVAHVCLLHRSSSTPDPATFAVIYECQAAASVVCRPALLGTSLMLGEVGSKPALFAE
jgi:hypothetical protein